MRIGFDAKRAVQNFTGLGNYSRYVIEALQEYFPDNEYVLYAPKRKDNARIRPILQKENTRLRTPEKGRWKKLRALWRVWGVTHELPADGVVLYHGLSNELPLNIHRQEEVKSVVTVHDLIFRRLPECYHTIDRWIYDYKFRKACQHADRIIAVSECTKQDIVSDYHIPADKIEVIYQGCDPAFSQKVSEEKRQEVRKAYSLPDRFILSVGTIEKRKNTLLAVKALPLLPEDLHLVLVGRETPYVRQIKEFVRLHHLEGRVHLLHGIPFPDLPALYQCADAFIYPSVYEGFGIPILEALNSRIPVIAATGSCLEEAGGPHSLYVSPDKPEEAAEAIRKALTPEHRHIMIEEGVKWAGHFSKEQAARQVMDCYKKVLFPQEKA